MYSESISIIKQAGDNAITSFQGMALATQGLSEKEAIAFLVKNQLRLGTEALTQEKLAELLVERGLTSEKAKETAIEVINTTAKKANAGAINTQTGANLGFLASTKATTVGLLQQAAAWAMTPFGMATIAIGAIIGIIKVVDLFTVSLDEQKEKLKETKEEYDSLSNSLETTKNELQTTKDRLEELLDLQNSRKLTFVEEDELLKLKQANTELEKEIALQEIQIKNANKKLVKEAVATFNKDLLSTTIEAEHWWDTSFGDTAEKDLLNNRIAQYEKLSETIDTARIKELQAIKADPNQTLSKPESQELKALEQQVKNFENLQEYLEKKRVEMKGYIGDLSLIENPDTDDEKAFNEWYTFYDNLGDKILKVSEPEKYRENKFNKIFDTKEFKDTKKEFEELGKQGQLTAEKLNDPQYKDLIAKLNDVGFTVEDVIGYFNSLGNASDSVTDSLGNLKSISDHISKIKSLADAYDDFIETGVITA